MNFPSLPPTSTPRSTSLSSAFIAHITTLQQLQLQQASTQQQSLTALQTQLGAYLANAQSSATNAPSTIPPLETTGTRRNSSSKIEGILDSRLNELTSQSATKSAIKAGAEFSNKLTEKQSLIDALTAQVKHLQANSTDGPNSLVYGLIDLLLILQPNLVISHIASPAFSPNPHYTLHADTTLLFADISGYTALAQTLGAAGAHGTEMLSQSLDDFFGIAISSIYKHCGDVIKFCGDAILCVFEPDKTTTPRQAAEQAARCAMELKAKLRFFQAAEGVVLDLKQMLSHGNIVGNYVGDKALNHFEFLITGEALSQIAATEHYVVPGDIILSREMHAIVSSTVAVKDVNPEAAALGFKLLVSMLQSNAPVTAKPTAVKLSASKQLILELFNEPSVVSSLSTIAGSWSRVETAAAALRSRISRHDLCTIMFISIDSVKLNSPDPQTNLDGLNEAFLSFYSPTKLFGGTLRQFLTDDKGTVAIIVFSGRESNTISACRCALRIKENFAGHEISSNIGIATGKVFYGPVGDERRCEMAWIGDSVNLSARLMGKAKDTVMVDKTTCENASSEITFEMFGMVELKGKGAVALYELQGLKHNRASSVHASTGSASLKLLSRPQIFDNAISLFPSIASETTLNNARKTPPPNHSATFSRTAATFTVALCSLDENLLTLLRTSIVDFGGELLDLAPNTTADRCATGSAIGATCFLTGCFLTGELPIRQSGGTNNHLTLSHAITNLLSFLKYLLTDLTFLDASPPNCIASIATSTGVITVDIAETQSSLLLATSEAIDETIELSKAVQLCGISASPPRIFCPPAFMEALPRDLKPSPSPSSFTPPAPHAPFHDITSLTSSPTLSNPGIGMPLSFVRRFHSDAELDYANTFLTNSLAQCLHKPVAEGDPINNFEGHLGNPSVLSLTYMFPDPSTDQTNPKQALLVFRQICTKISTLLHKNNGGILLVTPRTTTLHILAHLPVPIPAAAFLASKLLSKSQKYAPPNTRAAAIIHQSEVTFRASVNGAVLPDGPAIHDIMELQGRVLSDRTQSNSRSGSHDVFVHASTVTTADDSNLISFHEIPEQPGWLQPRDVLTSAVKTVFADSSMIGRVETRKNLSHSLERLLLVGEASVTVLEARAGFGKSMVAKEVMEVAKKLNLQSLVVRTIRNDEANMEIWITLCHHLLSRYAPEDLDLLTLLPEDCSELELSYLNEFLPHKHKVSLNSYLSDNLDLSRSRLSVADADDDDFDGDPIQSANSSVKLQLFSYLLRSLLANAAPFILVIEDLHWLDSASWKVLLVAAATWSQGVMIVCTTRPVPNHAAFEYSELCKTPGTTRESLEPLDSNDLAKLMKAYLPSKSSPKVLDRLKSLSRGFPFLAVELLRDAALDKNNSLLGASDADMQEQQLALQEETLIQTKDPYTDDEKVLVNSFMDMYTQDIGWTEFAITNGVTMSMRDDDEGLIRQGKATGIVPNSTAHSIITKLITSCLDINHPWSSLTTLRNVVEVLNDHSSIMYFKYLSVAPGLYPRDSVLRFLWKEVTPGTWIFLTKSEVHPLCPKKSDHVRMNVKFFANILKEIPNTNSVHETIMIKVDPGGIIPASVVNGALSSHLAAVNFHIDYFLAREDFGVPLLKSLVKKRLMAMKEFKTLGVVAVMGTALESVAHLAKFLVGDELIIESNILEFKAAELLEATDDGSLRFNHAFVAEVAATCMEEADRSKAHCDAAEILMEEYKHDETKTHVLVAIAHHFSAAKKLEEARTFTIRAANHALLVNEHVEAKALLEELLVVFVALGKNRNAPMQEFDSLDHEELFVYVSLGKLQDAHALVKKTKSSLLSCVSTGYRYKMAKLKKRMIHPSAKILTSPQRSYMELQCRMWLELVEAHKPSAPPKRYAGLVLQLIRTATASGKTNSFVLALLTLSRYFVAEGDHDQANRIAVMAESHMPDEPTLLIEGWASFCRGETMCSQGAFEEAAVFLREAEDDWFEDGEFFLWVMALQHFIQSLLCRGELAEARAHLSECETKAGNSRAYDSLRAIYELQVFVAAEMGEIKDADKAVKKLEDDELGVRNVGATRKSTVYLFPYTYLLVSEGLLEDVDRALEELEKPLSSLPAYLRDWTHALPLYWCVSTCFSLVKMAKQHGQKSKIPTLRLAAANKKLKFLATKHKGAESMSDLCSGFLDIAEGDVAKACGPKGGFSAAVRHSTERETAIVGARAKVALAETSREALSGKISMAMSALEVFQARGAYLDMINCVLLLAQLDPKNTEFREMARMNTRRKSSSRKSKGSSDSVVEELETLEDIPLAGRKEELTTLIKAANALRTSSQGGADVTIVLEAAGGMGKSALMKSFMKDVKISMNAVRLYTASSSQFEKNTAYYLWKKVFENMLQLNQGSGRSGETGVAQEVLLATLGDLVGPDRARDYHPLLNPLLPFDFPDSSFTATLSSSARLSESMNFFYEILINQKGKTLICLEDAHWADELSWGLIERVHEASEVMVVMTTRPDDDSEDNGGSLREFWELEGVEVINLGALDEGALREHIAGLLEVGTVSEGLVKLIENRTGGNLLYIQELVSSLTESGMLLYHENGVDLKNDVDELVVPDNVQAVIASRLAGLSPSQQSLLQTASVIGREFTLPLVVEVHPASEMLESVGVDMKEIVRKRLVERVVGSGGEEGGGKILQFSHKFVQESIYQSCLVSTRKQVHKSIAKHLELDKASQLSNFYGIIAHHYYQAEEWRSAAMYLQLSGEENEKLEMYKTVEDALTKWLQIHERLALDGGGPAINGRFESSREEFGIVCVTLAYAMNSRLKFKEAYEFCIKGMANLGPRFPAKLPQKIKTVTKGLAALQWVAVGGGKLTYNDRPSAAHSRYYDALFLVGKLCLRRRKDILGYLAAAVMSARGKYAPVKARLLSLFSFVLLAPVLRLWKIYDMSIKETNRLGLEGGDASSAIVNIVNGVALSAKGELKQSAAAFKKAANDFMRDRDIENWSNAQSWSALSMFENGLGKAARSTLKKAYLIALENNDKTAILQMAASAHDVIAWGKAADCQDLLDLIEKDAGSKKQYTQLAYIKWRLGVYDADEALKEMKVNQKKCRWTPNHLFLSDRSGSTLGFLEMWDFGVAEKKKVVGGVSMGEVMKMIVDNVKFLEKLGKHSNYCKAWALWGRGCVLRRLGRHTEALKVVMEGIEAASRTNSRSCLGALWLERGYCEDSLGAAGECVKSFGLCVEISEDCGLEVIREKGWRKLKEKGVVQDDKAGERLYGFSGMISTASSAMSDWGLESDAGTTSGRSMGLNSTLGVRRSSFSSNSGRSYRKSKDGVMRASSRERLGNLLQKAGRAGKNFKRGESFESQGGGGKRKNIKIVAAAAEGSSQGGV